MENPFNTQKHQRPPLIDAALARRAVFSLAQDRGVSPRNILEEFYADYFGEDITEESKSRTQAVDQAIQVIDTGGDIPSWVRHGIRSTVGMTPALKTAAFVDRIVNTAKHTLRVPKEAQGSEGAERQEYSPDATVGLTTISFFVKELMSKRGAEISFFHDIDQSFEEFSFYPSMESVYAQMLSGKSYNGTHNNSMDNLWSIYLTANQSFRERLMQRAFVLTAAELSENKEVRNLLATLMDTSRDRDSIFLDETERHYINAVKTNIVRPVVDTLGSFYYLKEDGDIDDIQYTPTMKSFLTTYEQRPEDALLNLEIARILISHVSMLLHIDFAYRNININEEYMKYNVQIIRSKISDMMDRYRKQFSMFA